MGFAQKTEMQVRGVNKKAEDLLKNKFISDKVLNTNWNVLEMSDCRK